MRRFLMLILVSMLIMGHVPIGAGSYPKAIAVRTDLWDRLNDERAARGLTRLKWNGRLSEAATAWSRKMSKSGNFRHSDLQRLLGPYNYVGENIAKGNISAGSLHLGWMGSPPHRDTMLSPGFTEAGIGIWCSNGVAWATVNFARRWAAGPIPRFNEDTPKNSIVRSDTGNIRC